MRSKSCFRLSQQDREREREWEWGSSTLPVTMKKKQSPLILSSKPYTLVLESSFCLRSNVIWRERKINWTCVRKAATMSHNEQWRGRDSGLCISEIYLSHACKAHLTWAAFFSVCLNWERCGTRVLKGPYLPYSKEVMWYAINISHRMARHGLPPAARRYLLMGWLGNKAHHHHRHSDTPWGISLRALLALLCQLTISMRSLMHYELIEHKGAEGVSHWRRLVVYAYPSSKH